MKKVTIISILILAVFGYFIAERFISKANQSKKVIAEQVFTVETSTAGKEKIEGVVNYTGTVEGIHEAFVISQTAGLVEKVTMKVGSRCSANQVLAVVNNAQQSAAVEQAKAQVLMAENNYEKAEKDLKRTERLQSGNVATKDNLELSQLNVKAAHAQLKGAQAALKVAEKQLADTYVKAPFSGVISTKDIDIGATVAPGMRLAQIIDNSQFKVKIHVSENDAVKLSSGKKVEIKIDALPAKEFKGTVNTVGLSSESGLRTYPVEIYIDGKVSNELKSGMFARCQIVSESKEDAVIIPESAIITNNDGTTNVFISENGKALLRKVVVGVKSSGKFEITSGLTIKDKVITTGKERLTNGTAIKEK